MPVWEVVVVVMSPLVMDEERHRLAVTTTVISILAFVGVKCKLEVAVADAIAQTI